MVVAMPYTIQEFNNATVQNKFKASVANAAGTTSNKVTINSVMPSARRRMLLQTGGVDVDFSVEVEDALAATALVNSNKLSLTSLNAELEKEGLQPISAIKCALAPPDSIPYI